MTFEISYVSPLLQEVFLQQVSWNRAASTWTPRASSLSTRYFPKPEAWVKVLCPICLLIYSSKPSPRWCRQMRMGSLLEEMLWFFLSCHATTRRWTSPTGKWLTYTVSVLQLDLEQGCLLSVRMIYMLKDKHVNVSCFQPHWQEEWQLSAWWAERLRSKLCLTSGQPCLGRPYAMQVGLPPVFGLKSACFLP